MESWLQMLSPMMNFRLPASGDMVMDYKPWTNWGQANPQAGSPQIEEEIFRDVALPGKQLGRLIDAVNALIEIDAKEHPGRHQEHEPAFQDLQTMTADIVQRKHDLQHTMKAEAERALELLGRADPEAFRALLEKYHRQSAPA